ncbi:hypothetical protein EMCRGX_G031966 [Ephydatia muelleri]
MSYYKGQHKWAVGFPERPNSRDNGTSSPPGYTDEPPKEDEAGEAIDPNLLAKQGWSIALGPWKQLPMNLLVLWLAGNTLSLFPIMMVGMMFLRPFQAIFSYKQVYDKLKGEQALLQLAVYLLANLMGIALAMYKVINMGVLPISPSDWLEFIEPKQTLETAGGGLLLS